MRERTSLDQSRSRCVLSKGGGDSMSSQFLQQLDSCFIPFAQSPNSEAYFTIAVVTFHLSSQGKKQSVSPCVLDENRTTNWQLNE